MAWIKVAAEKDLADDRLVVDCDDVEIVIFRLEDGYFAIEDECSHAEASLSEGEIREGCKISCPLHGAMFDIRTGKNLSFPAVMPVNAFPVKVEDGDIFIDYEG